MGWRKQIGPGVILASFPTQNPHKRLRSPENLTDHPSERARFPAWLARLKGIGKAPTADGEIAKRATPEPDVALP